MYNNRILLGGALKDGSLGKFNWFISLKILLMLKIYWKRGENL